MSEKPLHRGRGWGGSPTAMPEAPSLTGRAGVGLRDREAFFDSLEEGLQCYFDHHDRLFGGIIHLTVGVREGKVGGIIKSQEVLHYSGFTLDRVRGILAYVLPKYVPRTEVPLAVDAVIEELRMGREEPKAPKRASRTKKQSKTTNTEQQ